MKNTKRILIVGALGLMAFAPVAAEAQVYAHGITTEITGLNPVWNTSDWDSSTNAAYKVDSFKITEFQQSVTFTVVADKLTGNTGGYIRLRGSSASTIPFSPITTINMANADSTYSYTLTGNPFSYYETEIQDTGTGTRRYKTYILVRRPPGTK